ncbi:unnamed protein product [Lymnaea stagnalis]|uniref:Major facilitator superfamily (MFS) profile domain-containing protein n=1 Tax=Lymnaea stagnalis TaxID=6523 RepID=A0AAV2I9R8_LYMST
MEGNGQLAEEYHPQRTPSPSPAKVTINNPRRCVVNRKLLPIKGFYLVFMAAVGDLLPFIALFMKQLGLTPHETGIIYGIMPFIGFFVRPVIGAFADKFKQHKMILIVISALTGIFYFLLIFTPSRPNPQTVQIHSSFKCNVQDSFIQDCLDETQTDSCSNGLTAFANVTERNQSLSCTFHCQTSAEAASPEFSACFTNDTGPFDVTHCNGTLSHGKHLNFIAPDLRKLIEEKEIARDRMQAASLKCWDYDPKDILFEKSNKVLQILCSKEVDLKCTVKCPQSKNCTGGGSSFDRTFFTFFFIFLLANIAFAPIFPILDASAYQILGEDHHLWGNQRAWGTLGFALFAVTATFITQGEDGDFIVTFYLFLPLCIISAIIAYFIPISSDIKCGQFVKNVCRLLSYGEVSAFLIVVMYFGMLTGALETFLFWFLSDLHGSPLVVGFVLLVNCCAELPMLLVAGTIIKFIGLVNCLYLAMISYGIRMLVYSFLTNSWLALLVEPLHGVCFGLMYAAASSYASIIAPPGMSATVQGLLGGVHFGFGKGLGSFITGFMFQSLGPRWTWRAYAITSVVLLFLYILLNKFVFTAAHKPPIGGDRVETASDRTDDHSRPEEILIKPRAGAVDTAMP